MNTSKKAIVVSTFIAVSACGGTTTDPIIDPGTEELFIQNGPNFTDSTDNSFRDLHASIGRSARSDRYAFGISPANGNAIYEGGFVADNVTVNGSPTSDGLTVGLVGDTRIETNFNNDRVSGEVDNVHFFRGGGPVEQLDGSLTVGGTLNDLNGDISEGTLSGTLVGGFGTTSQQSVPFDLAFDAESRRPNDAPRDFLGIIPIDDNLRYLYSNNVTGSGFGSGIVVEVSNASLYGVRQ